MSRDVVSDHAALRYLERVYGVNVAGIKARISKATAQGRKQGATAVQCDGVKYRLSEAGVVVTVVGISTPQSNRARRWKMRRK